MNRKDEKSNAGMTLIEVMVVLSLLSMFSIFLVSLVTTSQNAMMIQNTAVPVRTEAKQAMEAMVKELREADPSAPGGVVIGGVNNSQITFQVPNQVSQTGILSWRQIQFSHDAVGQQVIRTENAAATILGRNVTSLTFTLAANVITTALGASRTTPIGATVIQFPLTSQVRLRN